MDCWQALFTEITVAPHTDMAMDPHWIEFRPYKIRIGPGDQVCLRLCIKNYFAEAKTCRLRFRSIKGAVLDPLEYELVIPAAQTQEIEVRARFPESFATHSLPVFADVTWDGQRLGEVAEAIAYW